MVYKRLVVIFNPPTEDLHEVVDAVYACILMLNGSEYLLKPLLVAELIDQSYKKDRPAFVPFRGVNYC